MKNLKVRLCFLKVRFCDYHPNYLTFAQATYKCYLPLGEGQRQRQKQNREDRDGDGDRDVDQQGD